MNAREQYLKKQNERLQDFVALLQADLEFTESVGAAFAFDMGLYEEDRQTVEHMIISWGVAIASLGKEE